MIHSPPVEDTIPGLEVDQEAFPMNFDFDDFLQTTDYTGDNVFAYLPLDDRISSDTSVE